MSDRDFLIWQDIAYQTEAHLLENGQRLPVETRMILAGIRDIARQRGDVGRQALIDGRAASDDAAPVRALPSAAVPPAASQDARPAPGRPPRRLAVLSLALLAAMLIPVGGMRSPVPLPPAATKAPPADMAPLRAAQAVRPAPPPVLAALTVEPLLAPNPLYAPAAEAALKLDRAELRILQRALRDAGQDLVADGIIGPETRAALAAWQAEQGHVPTGHFDPAAVEALKAIALRPARPRAMPAPPRRTAPAAMPVQQPGCPVDDEGQVVPGQASPCDLSAPGGRLSRLLSGAARAATPDDRGEGGL